MAKGVVTTFIVILVIIILLTLVVVFRDYYGRDLKNFGTWSDYETTICLNENQGCNVKGTSSRYRTCIPNSETGNGCITEEGVHTFKEEVTEVPCEVICFTSKWEELNEGSCMIYDDVEGTTQSSSQVCRMPDQYSYSKITRECVAADSTGTNGCVNNNGSLSSIGDIDVALFQCPSVSCFQGTWRACLPQAITTFGNCGGTSTECGTIIATVEDASCIQVINGEDVSVDPINCYAPDDPGPCNRQCFNFPCDSYPAGYGNITELLSDNDVNVYVELYDTISGEYLCADWISAQQKIDAQNLGNAFSEGPIGIAFDTVQNEHIRFRIVPSQTYASDGAFYLMAHIPYNAQTGIVEWTGSSIRIVELNILNSVGSSFDDIIGLDLFQFTEIGEPWILNHYTPDTVPIITDLFCSGVPCIASTLCTQPIVNNADVCI